MTKLMLALACKVLRRYRDNPAIWYRAENNGERVTLAYLYRARILERRCHRGQEGEADAAHEYRPTAGVLAEMERANGVAVPMEPESSEAQAVARKASRP